MSSTEIKFKKTTFSHTLEGSETGRSHFELDNFYYDNKFLLSQSLQKLNLHLMKEVIDGTIHCKQGAAELLVQEVYCILTNRR